MQKISFSSILSFHDGVESSATESLWSTTSVMWRVSATTLVMWRVSARCTTWMHNFIQGGGGGALTSSKTHWSICLNISPSGTTTWQTITPPLPADNTASVTPPFHKWMNDCLLISFTVDQAPCILYHKSCRGLQHPTPHPARSKASPECRYWQRPRSWWFHRPLWEQHCHHQPDGPSYHFDDKLLSGTLSFHQRGLDWWSNLTFRD